MHQRSPFFPHCWKNVKFCLYWSQWQTSSNIASQRSVVAITIIFLSSILVNCHLVGLHETPTVHFLWKYIHVADPRWGPLSLSSFWARGFWLTYNLMTWFSCCTLSHCHVFNSACFLVLCFQVFLRSNCQGQLQPWWVESCVYLGQMKYPFRSEQYLQEWIHKRFSEQRTLFHEFLQFFGLTFAPESKATFHELLSFSVVHFSAACMDGVRSSAHCLNAKISQTRSHDCLFEKKVLATRSHAFLHRQSLYDSLAPNVTPGTECHPENSPHPMPAICHTPQNSPRSLTVHSGLHPVPGVTVGA